MQPGKSAVCGTLYKYFTWIVSSARRHTAAQSVIIVGKSQLLIFQVHIIIAGVQNTSR